MTSKRNSPKGLCVNFENSKGHILSLDNIYQQYQHFYGSMNGRVPVCRETCAKLILQLFHVERTNITNVNNQRNRQSSFVNLKMRENHKLDIVFPQYCTASATNDQLDMICPTEIVCNDKVIWCRIKMNKSGTVIDIKNKIYNCGFVFPITQASVDGLIYLIQQMKFCEGKNIVDGMVSQSYITESLSWLPQNDTKRYVQRSKCCKVLLSFLSHHTLCETCIKTFSKAEKRKLLQTGTGSQPKKSKQPEKDNMSNGNKPKIPRQPLKEVQNRSSLGSATNGIEQQENCDPHEMIQLDKSDHEDLTNILESVLAEGAPPDFKVLLQSQLRNCKSALDVHQRKWDPKIISVCLSVFLSSPKAYEKWKSSGMVILPSKRLLQYFKNTVQQTPGFNKENLMWMKKEASSQNISDFGRHGGLIIDEMTIQDDLVIERRGDTWHLVGVFEMGETNNSIEILRRGKKEVQLATHALQFVFHGLTGFRWPVVYFGSLSATAHQLYVTFWECVHLLEENGFTVDYVMTDGASANRTFFGMLFNGNPRTEHYIFRNVYDVQHKMCAIQDIMHVLKKMRNNIESSRIAHKSKHGRYLILNNKPIVWDHWVQCYTFNNSQGLQINPKLTDEHFNLSPTSKMRNKLAIHVLDRDMLYLMKAYQATLDNPELLASSIDFLEQTSILTDIFCNINRPISDKSDTRIESLKNVVKFFNAWEDNVVHSPLGNITKHLITRETREDINSSLLGFISLCELMLGRGDSINPGFTNSDLVENLFNQQRGIRNGLNTNPTLSQYGPANTAITLGQCSVSARGNSGNTASFFKATTPCALNTRRNKNKKKLLRI